MNETRLSAIARAVDGANDSSRSGLLPDSGRGDNATGPGDVARLLGAPAVLPALLPLDADAAGMPSLPADHPPWQRDVVSMSARARALLAHVVPVIVRTFSYWDHRIREIAFGPRTLSVDPAGCYRLR